jgi:hypothetical protein
MPDIINDFEPTEVQADLLAAVDTELSAIAEEPELPKEPPADEPPAAEAAGSVPEPVVEDGEAQPKGTEPADAAPAAAAEPDKPAEEKPSDQFGALDKDTPEKTRERFQTLKDGFDKLSVEHEKVRQEADGWIAAITSTGTNPQQFALTMQYLTKVNSTNPADLEEAYNIMQGELKALGKVIGKAAPGVYDPLDEHGDLKKRVEDGMLDPADAAEIIKARALSRMSASQRQQQQQTQTQEAARQQALAGLTTFGQTMRSSDPLFAAKMPYLESILESVIASGIPPDRWLETVQRSYAKLNIPAPMATPKPTAPNPLRPTGTSPASSSVQKEPGSIAEAVNLALDRGY